MSTGHPLAGFFPPPCDFAFGTVTRIGIEIVSVGIGSGLKRVRNVLVGSSGDGPPFHEVVSGAVGLAGVGRVL
jgi:hypothetical protein